MTGAGALPERAGERPEIADRSLQIYCRLIAAMKSSITNQQSTIRSAICNPQSAISLKV
jgi:hypothetical protein